jgi:hypothetical protein
VAGGVHDSLAVPAYFETFAPFSLSEATNGSAHGYQSPFYAGFFLTAAAGQFGFPPPPGTTETLYPQGPTQGSAAGAAFPGAQFASSTSRSGPDGSSGQATGGAGALGPEVTASGGSATSAVDAAGGAATATASIDLHDVSLAGGMVKIGEVVGRAAARATGQPGQADANGGVVLIDVSILGQHVTADGRGLTVGALPLTAPAVPVVDQTLKAAGVTIERLPDSRTVLRDGTAAELHVGGFEVVFSQPAQEFAVTVTLGRLDVSTRAVQRPPAPPIVTVPVPPVEAALAPPVPPPRPPVLGAAPLAVPARPAPLVVRRITQTLPARSADWSGIAALLALAAPVALVLRRVFRLAAAP